MIPRESLADILNGALRDLGAGRVEQARASLERALAAVPDHPDAIGLLAVADLDAGEHASAEQRALRALSLAPRNPQHAYTLGRSLDAQGRYAEAASAFRRALSVAPQSAELHLALGLALANGGHLDAAVASLDRAAQLDPGTASIEFQLAAVLQRAGRLEEAVSAYERGLVREPAAVPALVNLGAVLGLLSRNGEAERVSRRALALDPRRPEAHVNLGRALGAIGFQNEAVECLERAIALGLRDAPLLNDLGGALYNAGLAARAIERYREAVAADPTYSVVRSNLLLAMNYEETDPAVLLAAHREADRVPRAPAPIRHRGTRLRIGYVSPDFRAHSVAFFIEPILERSDRARIETFCYHVHPTRDRYTERMRSHAGTWVDAHALSDATLAERIRADGIDVLVDLAGHTGGNRLPLFAQRPAPVQATYLGYPTTTGLAAIDYRVTDAFVDPPGEPVASTELPLRLPGSYFCYRALPETPQVGALPAREAGQVTFGSFNNLVKVSPETLDLWAAVLAAVPGARLVLKNRSLVDPLTRMRIADRLAARGVEAGRVFMTGWEEETDRHLDWYNRVDIALDTFPYNGATTTCEALWMGVPVASLSGRTHASRMGRSILTAAGMPDWVASDRAAFTALCVRWAEDLEALADLRAGLRARMAASPLMDEPAFVRAFESLLAGAAERRPAPVAA